MLRRPAGGPDQPQPGRRIHPGLLVVSRRDEPAGKLPGGFPPRALGYLGPRKGRLSILDPQRKMRTNMEVKRTGIILKPTNSRVVIRPFEIANESRVERIIARVSSLTEPEVEG